MKKIFISMAAVAAAICTISCNKDMTPDVPSQKPAVEQADDMVEVTFNVGTTLTTKATNFTEADEEYVGDLQILAFSGDELDAYNKEVADPDSETPLNSITISFKAGVKDIYIFANAPDLSMIVSKATLLATVSDLSDNSKGKFVMMATQPSHTFSSTTKLTLPLTRLASKVIIKKVTRNFSSPALAAMDFRIDEIFLINVGKGLNYGLSETSDDLYNKSEYLSGLPDFTRDIVNVPLANGEFYNENTHTFYCYPNDDSTYPTRLVVKTTLWDDANNNDKTDEGETVYTYYYPITLPSVESNRSYEIAELIITRRGADVPDTRIQFNEEEFGVNVSDWSVYNVSDFKSDFVQI